MLINVFKEELMAGKPSGPTTAYVVIATQQNC
jgi:hypothetical protein